MTSSAPRIAIGVFDSGVGGLSVFDAVRRRMPDARYAYCADNAHFPYGLRAEADLIHCVVTACERFVAKAALDVLIIACNTASMVALPALRAALSIPVVGVVPAIKPAAAQSKSKVIALLATPGAVKSKYADDLVEQFAGDCHVVRVGSNAMVQMAEGKMRGLDVDAAALKKEIAPIFAKHKAGKVDVVVMGCTHFPLLTADCEAVAAWPVAWIDSGDAVAARVAVVTNDISPTKRGDIAPTAYVTRLDEGAYALTAVMEHYGFTQLTSLT
jgi:glutamate racemase